MKALISVLVLLVNTAVFAGPSRTRVIQKEVLGNEVETDYGFSVTGFEDLEALSFCFQGEAKDVCGLAKKAAAESIENYSSGDHGYFEVAYCRVLKNGSVSLKLLSANDYDDGQQAKLYKVEACKL